MKYECRIPVPLSLKEYEKGYTYSYVVADRNGNEKGDGDIDIEGTCGGSISCCTCHVIIDPKWFNIVGEPNPDEEDMLDLAHGLQPTSRLSCQIEITNELDGLRMIVPEE